MTGHTDSGIEHTDEQRRQRRRTSSVTKIATRPDEVLDPIRIGRVDEVTCNGCDAPLAQGDDVVVELHSHPETDAWSMSPVRCPSCASETVSDPREGLWEIVAKARLGALSTGESRAWLVLTASEILDLSRLDHGAPLGQ